MHGTRILPFLGVPFERFDLSWVGGAAETMRTVRRPAQDVPAVAPPLHAPLRPVRVAGSACLVAHVQLLLACSLVVASASRPNWQ